MRSALHRAAGGSAAEAKELKRQRLVLTAVVIGGSLLFAGALVENLCADSGWQPCRGFGDRFALASLLRAGLGLPLLALWWQPRDAYRNRPLIAVVALAPLWMALWALAAMASFAVSDQHFVRQVVATSQGPLLCAAMVFAAPLYEEMLFRGAVLGAGRRWSRWVAVIGSAALWASVHAQYDLVGVAILFAMGVVLGVMRVVTGSVWPSIVAHGWWNLAVLWVASVSSIHH